MRVRVCYCVQVDACVCVCVLIVDVWNVDMDEAARQESILSSTDRDELVAAYQKNRAQFGADNWF